MAGNFPHETETCGGTVINKRFDVMAGTGFLAIGVFFVAASRGITRSSYGSNVGPAVFPTLLGIILIGLSIIVISKAIAYKGTEKVIANLNYRRLAALIGAIAVYIVIFEPLGYVISTFIFLSFVFQLMERKKLLKSLLISAIFSSVVYVTYVVLLQGNLPPFPEFLTNLFARG
ncbi:MAG: tripartite tricarboxylate transporter TctB family protein [Spirochaetae bacterium HGW-Spirochaetae-9]|nr:MAG: tripartite tricarboxylate transporter TctB family protein [Spirochaetae bacterium HGW-Spirochaetae-9]